MRNAYSYQWLHPFPSHVFFAELYPAKYGLDADLPAVPVSQPPTFDVVSTACFGNSAPYTATVFMHVIHITSYVLLEIEHCKWYNLPQSCECWKNKL